MEPAFITAVQGCPALYDKANINYSNRVYINKLWDGIGKEFELDGQAARKKWTRLRDYFQRNRKKLKSMKSGSAPDKNKKWYLYNSLSFLIPYLADSNLSDVSDTNSIDDDASVSSVTCEYARNSENAGSTIEQKYLESQADASGIRPEQQQSTSSGRKRNFPYTQDHRWSASSELDILDVKALGSRNVKLTSAALDEDEHYCMSLVPKMKIMDQISKTQCQMEIHGVILKYLQQSTKAQGQNQQGHEEYGVGYARDFDTSSAQGQKWLPNQK